jgi:hypothetical protein
MHMDRSSCGLLISKIKRPRLQSSLLQSWSGPVLVFLPVLGLDLQTLLPSTTWFLCCHTHLELFRMRNPTVLKVIIRQWHRYSRRYRNTDPYLYLQGYCTHGYGYIPPRVLQVSTGKGTPVGTHKLYYIYIIY